MFKLELNSEYHTRGVIRKILIISDDFTKMERHEYLKSQCTRILEYYYANADTEFTLNDGERIDVVGYYNDRKSPDIGIEVELSSNLQHDAAKLARIQSIKLKIIVTELPDTLSLGKTMNIGNAQVHIVPPPDRDTDFESLIREYTGQTNKIWFNKFQNQGTVKMAEDAVPKKEDPLSSFIRELNDQRLDPEFAKDLIFRAAQGGIHLGSYVQKYGMTVRERPEIPKELHYLLARGVVFEDRRGKNYESGRSSIYLLSQEYHDLASKIIHERVDEKAGSLLKIAEKYSKSALLTSLIGVRGNFLDDDVYYQVGEMGLDRYSSIPLTSIDFQKDIQRYIVEGFNISPELQNAMRIVAYSPLFRDTLKEIYQALIQSGLGNATQHITTKGDLAGSLYQVPFLMLLKKLGAEEWIDQIDTKKLIPYAEWVIIRAHTYTTETLFNYFQSIGGNIQDAKGLIDELANENITSRLISRGQSPIAIYDSRRFNDFCEYKMSDLLHDLLSV